MKKETFVIVPKWSEFKDRFSSNDYFVNQAIALSDAGEKITVISIQLVSAKNGKKLWGYELLNHYNEQNVDIFIFDLYVAIPTCIMQVRDLYISYYYYLILRDFFKIGKRNCIIHGHVSHCCAYYCIHAARKLGIPLVITEHYSGYLTGAASHEDLYKLKTCIEKADKFIFVGRNFQKRIHALLDTTRRDTIVIPNMVDPSLFHIKEKKKSEFVFLCAGGLKKNKSIDLVIEAFHKVFSNDEGVRLLIAGDGNERSYLEGIVRNFDEVNRISFLGAYEKDEADEIFNSANVFVLTSKVETFGIVYVEAMMTGLPCIGTKGQGGDDIITDNTGFLVSYGDIKELSEKMVQIRKNYTVYKKSEIRDNAVKMFSNEVVSKQIIEVYNSVGGNSK